MRSAYKVISALILFLGLITLSVYALPYKGRVYPKISTIWQVPVKGYGYLRACRYVDSKWEVLIEEIPSDITSSNTLSLYYARLSQSSVEIRKLRDLKGDLLSSNLALSMRLYALLGEKPIMLRFSPTRKGTLYLELIDLSERRLRPRRIEEGRFGEITPYFLDMRSYRSDQSQGETTLAVAYYKGSAIIVRLFDERLNERPGFKISTNLPWRSFNLALSDVTVDGYPIVSFYDILKKGIGFCSIKGCKFSQPFGFSSSSGKSEKVTIPDIRWLGTLEVRSPSSEPFNYGFVTLRFPDKLLLSTISYPLNANSWESLKVYPLAQVKLKALETKLRVKLDLRKVKPLGLLVPEGFPWIPMGLLMSFIGPDGDKLVALFPGDKGWDAPTVYPISLPWKAMITSSCASRGETLVGVIPIGSYTPKRLYLLEVETMSRARR